MIGDMGYSRRTLRVAGDDRTNPSKKNHSWGEDEH